MRFVCVLALMCVGTACADGCVDGHPSGGRAVAQTTKPRPVNEPPAVEAAQHLVAADRLLKQGQLVSAAAKAALALKTNWTSRARWILAQAVARTDCAAALQALTGLVADPPWIKSAKLLALRAVVLDECGRASEANDIRHTLALNFPHTAEGVSAALTQVFSAEERLRRARAFENARYYDAAIVEARKVIGGPLDREARFFLARVELERVRENFPEAARAFGQLCSTRGTHQERACYLEAKAHGRAGQIVLAIDAYTRYRIAYPRGRYVEDAVFFRAFLLYESRRFNQARRSFLTIRVGRWAQAARWYAAWCAFRLGHWRQARKSFDTWARRGPKTRAGRRARYWAIRALAVHDPSEALKRAKTLFAERPMDWYSVLLLANYGVKLGAIATRRLPVDISEPRIRPGFDQQVYEIRRLHQLGLTDFARRALAEAAPRFRAAGRDEIEARLAREIGDSHRQHVRGLAEHKGLLTEVPQARDALSWRAMYPKAYSAYVLPASNENGVEPHLIYSFMRKESAFDPDALSQAHAVGLMQLLPKTAEAIERRTRRATTEQRTPRDLFDPERNIALGTWYIAALEKRFKGQLPLVAAAYNAGPRAVLGWIRSDAPQPTDVFVESIPFLETRAYVKHMTENLVAYDVLYSGKSLHEASGVIGLNLDMRVRPGIEF
ncbi:MAG: lytic transglycosylase domain-containing protein [Myxococcota bacterium]|nr:lytic transglycosylase domain-containing protein [Myxococcota bacterium]